MITLTREIAEYPKDLSYVHDPRDPAKGIVDSIYDPLTPTQEREEALATQRPLNFDMNTVVELNYMIEEGYIAMAARYGTGFPYYHFNRTFGKCNLGYNNARHADDFAKDIDNLDICLGLDADTRLMDRLAAITHDRVQNVIVNGLTRDGSDERDSAAWLTYLLKKRGHSRRAATIGACSIMGTEVVTDKKGDIIGQRGTMDGVEWPSEEGRFAAQRAADADFGHLYADTSPVSSYMIKRQRDKLAPFDQAPFDLDEILSFMYDQDRFLSGFRYSLTESEIIFGRNRNKTIEQVQGTIELLKSGRIETWPQLIAHGYKYANVNPQLLALCV